MIVNETFPEVCTKKHLLTLYESYIDMQVYMFGSALNVSR